jgi:hypothetical protein
VHTPAGTRPRRARDHTDRLPRVVASVAIVLVLLSLVVLDPGRLLTRTFRPEPAPSAPGNVERLASAGMGEMTAGAVDAGPSRTGPLGSGDVESDATGADVDRWGSTSTRPTADVAALRLEELRGGWRVAAGVEEAMALASISGHLWARSNLTAQGGSVGGTPVVVVEAVERPGTHDVVVTLLIAPPVAQDRTGTAASDPAGGPSSSTSSELVRLGVPVRLGPDGAVLAGKPWPLPSPARGLILQELRGSPVVDIELLAAARRALEQVGIDGTRLTMLEATDGWPFIAHLEGTAPGTGNPWLRWHVDRFVIAGVPLHTAAVETHGAPGGKDSERSDK